MRASNAWMTSAGTQLSLTLTAIGNSSESRMKLEIKKTIRDRVLYFLCLCWHYLCLAIQGKTSNACQTVDRNWMRVSASVLTCNVVLTLIWFAWLSTIGRPTVSGVCSNDLVIGVTIGGTEAETYTQFITSDELKTQNSVSVL